MEQLLTLKQIAQALELPEVTVRFYRDRYLEFIPTVGEGKRRRYKPEAVELLRQIAIATKRNASREEIRNELMQTWPITATIATGSQATIAATQQGIIATQIDQGAAFLALLREQIAATVAAEVAAAREQDRQQIAALSKRLEELENRARLPWWRRWIR